MPFIHIINDPVILYHFLGIHTGENFQVSVF